MAISLTAAGLTYTQNFNTLSNTAGSTTNSLAVIGWELDETGGGARDNEQYAVDTGSSTTGDTYSYGASAATDRALGSLRSGTLFPTYGAAFTNNSGSTIVSLTIGYTGETWRVGTASRADRLDFQYSTTATTIGAAAGWTDVDPLDFSTPAAAYASTGAKDGNLAANQTAISYTITGLNIAAGATFFIRWVDFDAAGADDGLAIDDFTLTATLASAPPGGETQTVAFASGSLAVAKAEGNSGSTTYSFTVERTGGMTGALTFGGTFGPGGTTATDFASGTVPTTFSGTIAAGASTGTVTITVAGDYAIEADESFTLTLNSASNPASGVTTALAASNLTATGTIQNDDDFGQFSVANVTVTEGDTAAVAGSFTVTRTGATGAQTVDYTITAGTATSADYSAVATGTLTFAEGTTSQAIAFDVLGDYLIEGNEAFSVTLSNAVGGATIAAGAGTATATIADNDQGGTIAFQVANYTVNEADGTVSLTLTRTGGLGAVTVPYTIAPGTAVQGADYTGTSGTATFAGGATTATITVPIVNDTTTESSEAFTVALGTPSAGTLGATTSATVTIQDDDVTAPAGTVSIAAGSVVEGNGGTVQLELVVTRSGGTAPFTVRYDTANGGNPTHASATAGSDYVAVVNGSLSFADGETTKSIFVTVNGDATAELSEEFTVTLSAPTNGATLGTAAAVATITTDDVLQSNVNSVWINEINYNPPGTDVAGSEYVELAGAAGTDLSQYSIVRYNGNGNAVYTTPAQTTVLTGTLADQGGGYGTFAVYFGQDGLQNGDPDGIALARTVGGVTSLVEFLSYGGTFTASGGVADGVTSTSIGVTQNGTAATTAQRIGGPGSTFALAAGTPGAINANQTYPTAGPALPGVAVSDVSVNEAAGTMTFTVTRTNVAAGAFSVDYATADGTATAGADYTATSGTLNFTDNQVSATVTVAITNDTLAELDETILLNLSSPSGATIVDAQGVGTIVNDDGTPISVAISDASVAEGDSGTSTLTFTVTRTGGTGAFDVGYATQDGTATTANADYVATSGTLSFGVGETSRTITVTVNGDTVLEPNETLNVVLSNPTNAAVLADATGVGTIVNDELTPIHAIQGNSYFSPIVAGAGITGFGGSASTTVNATSFTVTVRAIVTAIDAVGARQGFYITEETADWDNDRFTSEGIFVMTHTDDASVGTNVMTLLPGLAVGMVVTVTANVMEYRPFATNAPLTVLVNPAVTLGAGGQPVPTLTLDGAYRIPNSLLSGVAPDFTDSNDDPGDSFDASTYAMSFFETIEGMLVTVPDVRVADGFTTSAGGGINFKVYSGASADADQLNTRGGYTIAGDPALSPPDTPATDDNVIAGGKGVTDGDINPDILEYDTSDFAAPLQAGVTTGVNGNLSMGDRLGDVTGIIEWNFTDMKLFPTVTPTGFVDTVLTRESTTLVANPRALTFATFNVENLDPTDVTATQTMNQQGKFFDLARAIANNLGSPDILSIEEIQDNNGAGAGDGTSATGTDASITWQMLVDALNIVSGKHYQWVDELPAYNADGGEPNGNIRVGFLYNTDRVQLGNLGADAPIEDRRKFTDRLGDGVKATGDLIAFTDANIAGAIAAGDYTTTRKSLLAEFHFNGQTIYALANHLPSKGGSGTFWDASQENVQNGTPANSDWTQRSNVGEDIYTLLNYIQTNAPGSRVVAGGDFNDFYFYRPLETATGYVYANGAARTDGARLVNVALTLPEAERYSYTFDGRSQEIDHILVDQTLASVSTTDIVHINSGFQAGNRLSDHDPVLSAFDFSNLGEVLVGTSAGETINGFGGDDVIDGRGGTDTLIGGTGNDIFYVDSLDDVVIENAGEGFDEVRTTVSTYVLPANVERLVIIGGTGADTITGNAGPDLIDISQGGTDTVNAGDGSDGIFAGAALSAGDVVNGGAGADDQVGIRGNYAGYTLGAGNLIDIETLVVLSGSDTQFGGNAADRFSYNLTSVNDNVAAGRLLVVNANTLQASENLTFNGAAETDGSFLFYGGKGVDRLTGGQQSDGFFFGLDGRFGATDVIDGQGGADDQLGLRGDYSARIQLSATTLTGIETIVFVSATDTRFATGGSLFSYTIASNEATVANGAVLTVNANTLVAGEVATFDGSAETDGGRFRLIGGGGNDVFIGGAGDDNLFGALGADTLTGGGGNDVFRYTQTAQSTAASRDLITDFTVGDKIDMSTIDAKTNVAGKDDFVFIGTGPFSGAGGEVRATAIGASVWQVEGDTNGDGTADFVLTVTTTGGHALDANDFILVPLP